jgi:hypothetical protein
VHANLRLCRFQPAGRAGVHGRRASLGEILAGNGCSIVYGGGSQGLMGALADGALAKGGEVIGVLPKFMADLEWGHPGLTHLDLVEDMRERKHKLLTGRTRWWRCRRLRHARGTVRGDHAQAPGPVLQPDPAARHRWFLRAAAGLPAAGDRAQSSSIPSTRDVVAGGRAGAGAAGDRGHAEWREDARNYAIVR